MAQSSTGMESFLAPLEGMSRLPILRQLGLLIGLTACVAIGGYLVLWSQSPNYSMLLSNLDSKAQSDVIEELAKGNIQYQIDTSSGMIMVPARDIHDARLLLAKAGLPNTGESGFAFLKNDQGFGSSEMMETARFQHALESELARSIQEISLVESARVHLAIPKRSAFIRDNEQTSASVFLNLYSGTELDKNNVSAIRNLVAASVPGLDPANVTIVDQMGRLLSTQTDLNGTGLATDQFEYTRKLEQIYVNRIEALLTPIIGPGGVRAQVALDMDYSVTEQTEESFRPDAKAVRSEQVEEDRKATDASRREIPGTLSDVPPQNTAATDPAAVVPDPAAVDTLTQTNPTAAAEEVAATQAGESSVKTMRNYEIDKTVRHTRLSPGKVLKISAAIVVDNRQQLNAENVVERVPLTEEEVERLTALVKETIGFDEARGDSVRVFNSSFVLQAPTEPLPELPLFRQPWVWDIARLVMGAAGFILLVFGVVRPVLRGLATRSVGQTVTALAETGPISQLEMMQAPSGQSPRRTGNYEQELDMAKSIVLQDPKRVAQVVKTWVTSDA
jgi:flagellar M-ring protein FliF